MPDMTFQTLVDILDPNKPKQVTGRWADEILKTPSKIAEHCRRAVESGDGTGLNDAIDRLNTADDLLEQRFYIKVEPYSTYLDNHHVDVPALTTRLRRMLELTRLSLDLKTAPDPASRLNAERERLFSELETSSVQPTKASDYDAIQSLDHWITQASQDTGVDSASDRGVLACLHPDLRSVRQTVTIPVLYYEGERACIVQLTAEALVDGTGGVFPDPRGMTLAPLAVGFTREVQRVWNIARHQAGQQHACEIDVRWSLELNDFPTAGDYKLPHPIDGDSLSATLAVVFECLILGVELDGGWALTASVDEQGQLRSVGGVQQKAHEWFERRDDPSGYLLVTERDLTDAKQGAREAIPDSNDQCVWQVKDLEGVMRCLRDWERKTHGSVNFLRPRVPVDFTGREDAIDTLEQLLEQESSRYVLVSGEQGAGKSALLARMIEEAFKDGKRPVFHVAGHDSVELQESLVTHLKRKYQHDITFHQESKLTAVLNVVQEFLEQEDGTEILYLDGLDHPEMISQFTQVMPREMPSRFRCMIMTRNAERWRQALTASQCQHRPLKELVEDGGRRDVCEYLRTHGQNLLRPDVIDAIASDAERVPNFAWIRGCLDRLETGREEASYLAANADEWLRKPINSSIRPSVAIEFLEKLFEKGLMANVQLMPEHIESGRDIEKFCLPPRVVDAEQWEQQRKRASEQGRPGFHQRSESDDRYVMMSHEEFLREDGEDRVVPHQLSPPAADWQVIEGEPGEGKTTALWLMVARQCHGLLDRQQRGEPITEASGHRIPLVLPLRTVDSEQRSKRLIDLAREYVLSQTGTLESEKRVQLRKWLDEKIEREEYTLYLDAWDELPGGDAGRTWLKRQLLDCREVPLLMTTRTSLSHEARSLTPQPRRYRMVCFGNRQIREYVDRFFRADPKQGRELRERSRLSPGPSQLMQLPLLLGLMCIRKRKHPDEPLPQTRTELLQRGLYELFERGDKRRVNKTRRRRDRQKEQILRHIAWRFHAAEPVPMSEDNLLDVLEQHLPLLTKESPEDEEALLQEFFEDGVLVPLGSDTYQFVLRSFHEYCLAGWIAREAPFSNDEAQFQQVILGGPQAWNRDDWNDLRPRTEANWQHVWPLVAGQMGENAGWLVQKWPRERGVVVLRVADVLAETGPGLCEKRQLVNRCVSRLEMPADGNSYGRELAAQDLVRMWDNLIQSDKDLAKDVLLQVARNEEDRASSTCLYQLGSLSDATATGFLIDELLDAKQQENRRLICAAGLGNDFSQQALHALAICLNDENVPLRVRISCAESLGVIGTAAARDILMDVVVSGNMHLDLQGACAVSLGEIGDDRAEQFLIAGFSHGYGPMPEISRAVCARGLGRIQSPAVRDLLLGAIINKEVPDKIRMNCVRAAARCPNMDAHQSLLNVIDDVDSPANLLRNCCEALGDFKDTHLRDATRNFLIARLRSDASRDAMRQACAYGLCFLLPDKSARDSLIEGLRNQKLDPRVRHTCLWSLTRRGDSLAFRILTESLHDPDMPEDVKAKCKQMLGSPRYRNQRTEDQEELKKSH